MPLSEEDAGRLQQLKIELQAGGRAPALERFAAAALGRLMDVPIAVAKSGFQHGGDAGPGGRQGRNFRIECKKYSDGTTLDERELRGEIDQALGRDKALEAWILVTTRSASEQVVQSLNEKGESIGVPVIVIDWHDDWISPLAALCAFAPDLTRLIVSPEAGRLAEALQPSAQEAIESLRHGLADWNPGYEALCWSSHSKMAKIWNSRRTSQAELAQDAAGGAEFRKIRRQSVHDALNDWWEGSARDDAPAAVLGFEGVGKTWALLDWLVDRAPVLPIVLVIPSSAAAKIGEATSTTVKRFVGGRLREISGVRDVEHWTRRFERLLKRPADEGPIVVLVFDGLNQEPSVPWISVLKVLQDDEFAGRVRVVVTTRRHHFDERLSGLRGLVINAVTVLVDVYDDQPGGELDRMLAFEGLTRDDLHPDLAGFARTPRLFKLAVRLRDRFTDPANVTLHLLLWEYGRDELGVRAGRSFSEAEWRDWLKTIADRQRAGVERYSLKELGETANRSDLTANEVFARLSDIVDGQFAKPGPGRAMQLAPAVVLHALGSALLARLEEANASDPDQVEAEITRWLDPIAGLDQRADIIRAAVSILVASGEFAAEPAAALITAWLQTQNVTDGHRRELEAFAPTIPDALLTAIERSEPGAQASARLWAVSALRAIPRDNEEAARTIVDRASIWLSSVSREIQSRHDGDEAYEEHRAARYRNKLGKDESGTMTVLGVGLRIVDSDRSELHAVAPLIMEGFPLAGTMRAFEMAVFGLSIRGHSDAVKGLQWICLLNETDPGPAADALRALSADIRSRRLEAGIHSSVSARAASLLLWMSGLHADEEAASASDPGTDRLLTYENNYLANPSQSFFDLERRHASAALEDTTVLLRVRLQRTQEFWLDPDFEGPAGFAEELRAATAELDVQVLRSEMQTMGADQLFEHLEPALARCAPDLLAELMRRKMMGYRTRPPKARYWTAIHAGEHWLLAGPEEAVSAKAVREAGREPDESNENYAASQLLMLEIKHLDPVARYNVLIRAGLKTVPVDFREILQPLTPAQADDLIALHGAGSDQARYGLVVLLSIHPFELSNGSWSWLLRQAETATGRERGLIFRILAVNAPVRFGRELLRTGWNWRADADSWVNHFGTDALIEAGLSLPFEQLASRLAPSRVLEAARRRGADTAEVRLAAEVFGHVLAAIVEEPDPGSNLTVDRAADYSLPFIFSAEPRPVPRTRESTLAALNAATDGDAVMEKHRRASDAAIARIDEARQAGASLYLADLNFEDFLPVLRHAPDLVARWLDGCAQVSADFRRRVRLAEGAFLSLCEALLTAAPPRGAELWRALRSTMTTRYLGPAGVDELLHIPFRAPQSQEVESLRRGLLDLKECNSDQALSDLALAAAYNGNADWLRSVMAEDMASPLAWKQKRAAMLSGFTTDSELPIEGAWPEGRAKSDHEDLRRRSARGRWIDGSARHWWRTYLSAEDEVDAYAAWILFRNAADRRAQTWIGRDIEERDDNSAFFERKVSHMRLNRSKLQRAMKKRIEKFDKTFLGSDIVDGIGPWRTRR